MHVVATAGHVDHGKSTLVRALTGMEPDRWAEERRRGMTIDLGYAWTDLPSGQQVAFVDVPGHARFIGNMLAGLGPSPAVLFVVAADEGWRQQSAEHLAAVDGLGLRTGLLAVTRSDLADPGPAIDEARREMAASSLGQVEAFAVSGATGVGVEALRAALDRTVGRLIEPDGSARVRLWLDRSFSLRGAGTVVTGTLGSGRLALGDVLDLNGRAVTVRGLQSLGQEHEQLTAVARVAINLRGVDVGDVGRGDALLTPHAWLQTTQFDARVSDADDLPRELVLHVGTAALAVKVRRLGPQVIRISVARPLPLQVGDRALLRDPGRQCVMGGVEVLDVAPPALARRGAAAARGHALVAEPRSLRILVAERGCLLAQEARAAGYLVVQEAGVRVVGDWLVSDGRWEQWSAALVAAVDHHARAAPLELGLPERAAVHALQLPAGGLLPLLVQSAHLEQRAGRVRRPGAGPVLGPWLDAVRARLTETPFQSPDREELAALGAGRAELTAASAAGALLLLPGPVALLPDAPARAVRLLATLPSPFSVSEARQLLETSRRVAVPLLEYLDAQGFTRRHPDARREVLR